LRVIKNVDISLIAIDEAHCISQWWHDFRPSYMKIKWFIDDLKQDKYFPTVALTATATKKVREDIVLRLGLKNYKMYTKWFDRKNLVFIVREITKKEDKLNKVVEIIKKTPPYWIIYCSSIKAVKEVYEHLRKCSVNAWIYTWEMKSTLRESEQNNFMDSTYDVIVATNAFGMWIDKRDIRYVIHYNLPWSIENYYQEAGRAWRDWKVSYSIIIASYQDTIIQEFFIENAYPGKEDILKLYDYIFHDFTAHWWKDHQILMTYDQLAKQSKLKSGMQVWSIVKIFEKYWVVKRWFDVNADTEDFRGRWITITLGKKEHKDIPILWDHQDILKNESYFKLEQIKKLLFKPGCRKRFILEYFGDEEDIRNLWDNCWVCDYCIDKKKLTSWNFKEVVKTTTFFIVLEFIKRFDCKFWANILASILVWAKEKKITEWDLDLDKDYAILEEYSKEIIVAVFEVLINTWFLYKSDWQYPKIWLTEKWRHSIFDTNILLLENDDLQSSLFMKASKYLEPKEKTERKSKRTKTEKAPKESKLDTYTQTLELFRTWISIEDIAKQRELTKQTIESHIVALYSYTRIPLNEVMKLSDLKKLKFIKEFLSKSKLDKSKLWEIKYAINQEDKDISYVDIKLAQAMIEKKDL
jgi:ATP-dependent DNA helicase RecQ